MAGTGSLPSAKPRPDTGKVVLTLVTAMVVTTVGFLLLCGIVFLIAAYGIGTGNGSVGQEALPLLGWFIVLLLLSVPFQVWLTKALLERWTRFTIATGTLFWVTMLATVAQYITTAFLGPLSIGVGVAAAWWFVHQYSVPLSSGHAGG